MFKLTRVRAIGPIVAAALLAGCAAKAPEPVVTAPAPAQQPQQTGLINAMYRSEAQGPWAFAGVPRHGKAILVNIPSFELVAFEDGKEVMRSRVIIGKPSTPTPIMETETSVVRFRPTWTPTPRMIRSGKYTPGTRPPGKRNPLGFLAIRLEPGMLIYLHGTNKPQLYDREKRALSHGCVRVERWDEVAAWVLDLNVDAVHGHAYGRRTFDMDTGGIPVLIQYHTEFPDTNGVMQHHPDVYRRGTYASGAPSAMPG
jgi:murein L,D-transpeptidase YcbB/YkuD